MRKVGVGPSRVSDPNLALFSAIFSRFVIATAYFWSYMLCRSTTVDSSVFPVGEAAAAVQLCQSNGIIS